MASDVDHFCYSRSNNEEVLQVSIELTDEIQHIIDQAMKTGLYGRPEDVVAAALQSLAEDWEDLAAIRERAAEPRTALADLEAELRAEGLLT